MTDTIYSVLLDTRHTIKEVLKIIKQNPSIYVDGAVVFYGTTTHNDGLITYLVEGKPQQDFRRDLEGKVSDDAIDKIMETGLVISSPSGIQSVEELLEKRGLTFKRLDVEYSTNSHSPSDSSLAV